MLADGYLRIISVPDVENLKVCYADHGERTKVEVYVLMFVFYYHIVNSCAIVCLLLCYSYVV